MKLVPFQPVARIEVNAFLGRSKSPSGALELQFEVLGSLDLISWPAASEGHAPLRKTGLWENTCFEAFIKPRNGDEYWEINFSPTGDWNVFHFSDYRQEMREEAKIQTPVLRTEKLDSLFRCSTTLRLKDQIWPDHLDVGLTAVLRLSNGSESFWALKHAGSKPDFHLKEGFGLTVD